MAISGAGGAGGGGGASGVRAGRAYVELSVNSSKVGPDLHKGLESAEGKLKGFSRDIKGLLGDIGLSLGGQLGGAAGWLSDLAGVAATLGPQGALALGAVTLGTVVGKAALGFDALAAAQERGDQLTKQAAESYDKLITRVLDAAKANNDLAAAQEAQTTAVADYSQAERKANALRAERDKLEKELNENQLNVSDPNRKGAAEALQNLLPKLEEAEANLATQKKRRADADAAVKVITDKLLEQQDEVLKKLREEIDLRRKSADERLREAFGKLNPTPEKQAEFDKLAKEAQATKEYMDLTREASEKGAAAEKERLTTIEQVTKSLREQAAAADLSPEERVRRQLEALGASKEQIDQAVKDAAELDRVRDRPQAVRRAFRMAFNSSGPPEGIEDQMRQVRGTFSGFGSLESVFGGWGGKEVTRELKKQSQLAERQVELTGDLISAIEAASAGLNWSF